MPKRPPHGRQVKHRNRPRRPPPPRTTGATAPVLEQEEVEGDLAGPTVMRAATTSAAVPTPVAARRAHAPRRTPTTAINYTYLRRDVRTLALLAPGMIVLLVLAFIFLH